MAKKSFWQRGEDYAKKVSDEIIDQIKRGVAPWQKPWKPGERVELVEGFGRMIEDIGKPEERIETEAPDG